MKIRTDFVTNSSSSSFIISTDKTPPTGYERDLIKVTEETLPQILDDIIEGCFYEGISYSMKNEEIKEILHLTDEQMKVLLLLRSDKLDSYLDIIKALKESDKPVYIINNADDYWLSHNKSLHDFIYDSEIIEEERD